MSSPTVHLKQILCRIMLAVGTPLLYYREFGRFIAQAVSRYLPLSVALVQAWVRSCTTCGGKSCTGSGFLAVLLFPLPLIPLIHHPSALSLILIQGNWGKHRKFW
jgi:hypothetical protein